MLLLLLKLDNYKTEEIASIFSKLNTRELNDEEFGNIFEYFLTLEPLDPRSGVNYTPYSLRELMVSILDPQSNSSVYDPVAGTGGLLKAVTQYSNAKNMSIRGTEVNS